MSAEREGRGGQCDGRRAEGVASQRPDEGKRFLEKRAFGVKGEMISRFNGTKLTLLQVILLLLWR